MVSILTDKENIPIINKALLDFAEVVLRSDGIVHTHINLKKAVSLEQAKLLKDAYVEVTGGVKTPHLFTANKFVIIEKDVMEYMKEVANKYGKADAFVISSLPQKIMGNFYLKIVKPGVPSKLFQDKQKAIKWLKQYT